MANQLPVRSSSRAIQNRHLRRYASGKVTLVNPKVKKKPAIRKTYTPQDINKLNQQLGVSKQGQKSVWDSEQTYKLKPKLRWQEVMKPDDGTARPVSLPKLYNPSDALEELDFLPTRNEEEFDIEYIGKPIKKLNEQIDNKEITEEEAKEQYKEIIEEANAVLEQDEMEPDATIIYGRPENKDVDRGYLGTYTAYYVDPEDIDIRYVKTDAWRGYEDVIIPEGSKWELLHEDTAYAMTQDQNNLQEFTEKLFDELENRGIEYATVITKAGNFAQNITYLVEKGKGEEVKQIVEDLKEEYRDEEELDKEINPLYEGVKEAKERGLSAAQIKKSLGEKTTPETKKILEKAIKKAYK